MSRLVKAPLRKVTLGETGMVTTLRYEIEREKEREEHSVAYEKAWGWENSMNWRNLHKPMREEMGKLWKVREEAGVWES